MMANITKGIIERLKYQLRERNLKPATLSRMAGLSNDAVRNIFRGKSMSARLSTLEKFAKILDVDPLWLMTGRSQTGADPNFLMVKQYNSEQLIDHLLFKGRWLEKNGFDLESLSMITVEDDSMLPILQKGSLTLINRAEKDIITGKIYVFEAGNQLHIKMLQKLPNNTILVSSENKRYDSYVIRPEEIEIIGRIVLYASLDF